MRECYINRANERSYVLMKWQGFICLVQEKARGLFSDLKAARIESGDDCDEEFNASKGWFNRFKAKANLHNVKVQGEHRHCRLFKSFPVCKTSMGIE